MFVRRSAGVEADVGPAADREAGRLFEELLRRHGLRGAYWYEYDRLQISLRTSKG
jgi:hypothetical protein